MLTCREIIRDLMRYLDREIDGIRLEYFRAHLAGCRACAAYLETYRSSVALARAAHREERDPAALPERIVRSIAAGARGSAAQLWNLLAAVAASPLLFFYFGPK